MKFPKKIGKVADMLYKNKLAMADVNKELKKLKEEKGLIEDHIYNTFPKEDIDGAIGDLAKVEIKTKDCYSVDDQEAFRKFIKKTGSWDLLQKSLVQKAIIERLDDGVKMPFIKKFEKKTISCTVRKD